MSVETRKNRDNQPLEDDSVVVAEPKREQPSESSLQILQRYWSDSMHGGGKKLNKIRIDKPPSNSSVPSTEEIMQIARSKLEHCCVHSIVFEHSYLLGDIKGDVELALLLQASAKMVANQQFDRARKLLGLCDQSASANGSTVQRIVYYFARALKERMDLDRDTETVSEESEKIPVNVEEAAMSMEPALIACAHDLPFSQVTNFTGVHAILDNIASARKVHLVDFEIGSGSHWTIIMQDLANRSEPPIESLKITAVGTSKRRIERTGKWLSSFAETMNLPFSFKAIVCDIKDLRKELFELELADEVVAVYAEYRLSTLLVCPNQLHTLIALIQTFNPSVMVVAEAEAYTNTPSFLARFYNLLSYCTATLDCIATCMDRDHQYRKITEQVIHWELIRNVITTEGADRIYRHEKIDFWRQFFARFGIEEEELSHSALFQASFLIRRYPSWSHCSLDMSGKSMIIKWKGTPVKSLSVWKFCPVKNNTEKMNSEA
ncbi:PREDICTED: scarecrow-like protein 23 [Ipomoea nil]|uniref:scarecrow-like protein 23 n=1 Tax=Ipomoea nil TaxID=35883 RepID=UPI000900F8FE|nr:PREDICTED: scarecrow-like protein 23 [Ipomoea nil]